MDGNGLPDLIVANFFNRSTIAFQALANPLVEYRDATSRLGLAVATRRVLGFGLALADFDGDGWTDLIQANGHVLDRARLGIPFAMRPTVLRNTGAGFEEINEGAGPWFALPMLGPRAGGRRS